MILPIIASCLIKVYTFVGKATLQICQSVVGKGSQQRGVGGKMVRRRRNGQRTFFGTLQSFINLTSSSAILECDVVIFCV